MNLTFIKVSHIFNYIFNTIKVTPNIYISVKEVVINKRFAGALAGTLLIVLVCFVTAWAEEVSEAQGSEDYEVFNLGEIFVTAERIPAVTEVAMTSVITEEEIQGTNSRTVAEALTYVPGVRVSTGRKNEPNIQIRGLDQSRSLILIDGIPYYETNFGKLDLNQIPVDNIAKIEITKGSSSVLYGPNALAGVINIVTKKPIEKPTAEAILEIGENSKSKISLTHGMRVGIFNYWLNYTHHESGGWRMSNDFEPSVGTIVKRPGGTKDAILEDGGFRNNSDFTRDSLWAKVGVEPNPDSEYYINFHYINGEKGVPSSTVSERVFLNRPAFSGFARITRYDDWGIDLSGQQKITDKFMAKGKLFYHNHLDDYTSFSDQTYQEVIAVSRYKDYLAGGSLTTDFIPVEWNILRFGFIYRADSHKERDDSYLPFAESFSYTGSVSLENEWNRVKNLSVVLGLSYDWFEVTEAQRNITDRNTGDFTRQDDLDTPDTKDELNPMIGATYHLSDTTRLFGSIARKVRFPTLQQLYSTRSGNTELDAERSINYTLGVSHSFGSIAVGELGLFYYDISDFISRDAPGTEGIYRNYGKIRLMGFELIGEVYPMKDLIFTLGYTYNNARDRSDDRVADHVVFVPEHKIDIGLKYNIPYIITVLDLTGVYVGESYSQLPTPQNPDQEEIKTGDHFILNLRISKTFLKRYEAYLAINNILDADYESELGFPGLGRNFYIGLSMKFL
jgi:outer membrane receptor protein involved in Fe transport